MKRIALAILILVYTSAVFGTGIEKSRLGKSHFAAQEISKKHVRTAEVSLQHNIAKFTLLPLLPSGLSFICNNPQQYITGHSSSTSLYTQHIPLYLLHSVYRV